MVTDGGPMPLSQLGWEKCIPGLLGTVWDLATSFWGSIHEPGGKSYTAVPLGSYLGMPKPFPWFPRFSLAAYSNPSNPSLRVGRKVGLLLGLSHTQLLVPGKQPEPL